MTGLRGISREGVAMTGVATIICLVLAFATALIAGLHALRDRAVTKVDLGAAALTELAVLFYVGVRIAGLIGGHHTQGLAIVIAYLVGLVVVIPITAALARIEPSRWGSVTLGSGALVACALFARINQLWTPHG
jgi:hypothetical protein